MEHTDATDLKSGLNNTEEERANRWNQSLQAVDMRENSLIDLGQSSFIWLGLFITAIIPTMQLAVGWHYFNSCPVKPLIPQYLVVAGIIGLIFITLITVCRIMIRISAKKIHDETAHRENLNRTNILISCGVCSIMCINLSLFIFLMGWTVAGGVWVFEIWHQVQYHHFGSHDYCHRTLYRFTFTLLVFTVTAKILLFCFIFRTTCMEVNTSSTNGVITKRY